jgi:RNA-directed DNA polymerase
MIEITKFQKRLALLSENDREKLFDNLFRYIRKTETLLIALDTVLSIKGAYIPGVDGKTKENLFSKDHFVAGLSEELEKGTYQPSPVRRVILPKRDGRFRTAGIPTLKDRVVQEALRMVLDPIYESRFIDTSVGFRPGRKAMDAIHLITFRASNNQKFWWVVEGVIKDCFDRIPHKRLMQVIRKKIKCKKTLALIKFLLRDGIQEGEKVSFPNSGVFQAGIAGPLLVNIFLDEMDQYWWEKYGSLKQSQKDKRRMAGLGNVVLIRHADDFLIMTNGTKAFAYEIKEEFAAFLGSIGLELDEEKSRVTHLDDGFDFLGFQIKRVWSKFSEKWITIAIPGEWSIRKFKAKFKTILNKHTLRTPAGLVFHALNKMTHAWDEYYAHTNRTSWVENLNNFYWNKVYYWLKRKHSNVSSKGSIFKHVYLKYKCRKSSWNLGWEADGVKLRRLRQKRKPYRFNKYEKNIYLNKDALKYNGEDYSTLAKTWTGTSKKAAYIHLWESLIARDGGCVKCGATRELDIHHLNPQSEGGAHTLNNTVLLCKDCHRAAHAKK